jgi:hypothetical protein
VSFFPKSHIFTVNFKDFSQKGERSHTRPPLLSERWRHESPTLKACMAQEGVLRLNPRTQECLLVIVWWHWTINQLVVVLFSLKLKISITWKKHFLDFVQGTLHKGANTFWWYTNRFRTLGTVWWKHISDFSLDYIQKLVIIVLCWHYIWHITCISVIQKVRVKYYG